MMPQIDMGANFSTNKFKFCNKCEAMKPPEGGIEMGPKWHCQNCWTKRVTIKNLKANRMTRTKL